MVQDILFGTPKPHEANMDLGIMDPDYVNVVFNGHPLGWGSYYFKGSNKGSTR